MSEEENQRWQTDNFLYALRRVHNNMRLFKLDVFRTQNFDVSDLVSSNCCHLACSCSYGSDVAFQTSEIKQTKK